MDPREIVNVQKGEYLEEKGDTDTHWQGKTAKKKEMKPNKFSGKASLVSRFERPENQPRKTSGEKIFLNGIKGEKTKEKGGVPRRKSSPQGGEYVVGAK